MDIRPKNPKVEAKPYKLLTYSNISMFLECPMKYYFRNVVKITTAKTSEALYVGGIFHDAVEMYYKIAKETIDKVALDKVFKFIIKEAAKDPYYVNSNDDIIIQGMVNGFVHYFANNEYKIVENEIQFDIPFEEDGEFHRCGKTDAKMERGGKEGHLYLGEWKSAGQIGTVIKKIQVDNQGNNYLWAFEDLKPEGVIFRIARKSLLRLKKDEDLQAYRARIFNDYLKRPDENFHQEIVYIDQVRLKRWKHEVGQIKDQIVDFTKSNGWYRNTDACWHYNTLCPYFAICQTTNKKDFEDVKKKNYVEREPGEELFTIKE